MARRPAVGGPAADSTCCGRLTRSLVDRPFLLLVTAQRDDATSSIGPRPTDHPITIRMPTRPAEPTRRPTNCLAAVLGDRVEVEPGLGEQLYERSGGNALFLTELAEVAFA